MGCCGGMRVARSVLRMVAPMVRVAEPDDEPLLVLLDQPQATSCPYCGTDFVDRVEKRRGVWITRRWCSTCKLRFL